MGYKSHDYSKMASNFESQPSVETGFECEFLRAPPGELQTTCPLCFKIMRDPHMVMCCCESYCKECIEAVKACPTCKQEGFVHFEDKRTKPALYALKVRCSHSKEGCEWTGELGQLDKHLNTDPQPETRLEVRQPQEGCQFVSTKCLFCKKEISRKDIEKHQTKICLNRPFDCLYCNDYKSTFGNVMNNHWAVCGSFPLSCPNECNSTLQRQNVDSHVANECPLTTINCDFHHVGCTVKLPRQDMADHLRDNLPTHVSLLAISHAKQQDQITNLETENDLWKSKFENLEQNHLFLEANHGKLQVEVNAFKHTLENLPTEDASTARVEVAQQSTAQRSIPLGPPLMTMANIEHKKGDFWYSPPVYTHPQGYKICLKVEIERWGNQSYHVRTHVHFMKGLFDNFLTWPFQGSISIRIVDQVKGQGHRHFTSEYNTDNENCQRVLNGEVARYGQEAIKTIFYDGIETSKFLKNDTLVFQIYEVELY